MPHKNTGLSSYRMRSMVRKVRQIRLRRSAPDPTGGAQTTLPQTPSRLVRGYPLPIPWIPVSSRSHPIDP